MPSIRGSLSHYQPLIDVSIGRSVSSTDRESYRALIDTGATRTCISRQIVERHELEFRTKVLVQGADSMPARRPAYAFSLGVYCQTADRLGDATTLYVLPHELVAPAFLERAGFDVLIGMDFLSTGKLIIDRQDFSFEFG
jgi:hypothetical protein